MRIITQIKFITAPSMAELEQATNNWLANMTGRVQSVKYLYQKNAEGAEHQAHVIYTVKDTKTEQDTEPEEYKPQAKEQCGETVRSCGTCRYVWNSLFDEPCCNCDDLSSDKWEPEEATP